MLTNQNKVLFMILINQNKVLCKGQKIPAKACFRDSYKVHYLQQYSTNKNEIWQQY